MQIFFFVLITTLHGVGNYSLMHDAQFFSSIEILNVESYIHFRPIFEEKLIVSLTAQHFLNDSDCL